MLFKDRVGIGVVPAKDFLCVRHCTKLWGHESGQETHSLSLMDFSDSFRANVRVLSCSVPRCYNL